MRKIVLAAGTMRAIHVLTPALVNRLKNGGKEPLMAVRTSADDYASLQLFELVAWKGRSEIAESFAAPMPGTSGRGVAVVYTASRLICYYKKVAPIVASPADASIEEVYAACQKAMIEWQEESDKLLTSVEKAWVQHFEKRRRQNAEEAVKAESSFKALTEIVEKVDVLESKVKNEVRKNNDIVRKNNDIVLENTRLKNEIAEMRRRERQLARDLEIRRLEELKRTGNAYAAEPLKNLLTSRQKDPEAIKGVEDDSTHNWLITMSRSA